MPDGCCLEEWKVIAETAYQIYRAGRRLMISGWPVFAASVPSILREGKGEARLQTFWPFCGIRQKADTSLMSAVQRARNASFRARESNCQSLHESEAFLRLR